MKIIIFSVLLLLSFSYIIWNHNLAYANTYDRLSQTIASENHVYVIWSKVSDGIFSIMFAQSSDYGNTFAKTVKISDDVGFGMSRISNAGNNLYLAWDVNTENRSGIFLKKSTDYGNTFGPAVLLSNQGQLCNALRMLESFDSNVYIFFSCYNSAAQEGSIVFRASHDNGTTFGEPITLFQGKGIFSNGPFWASIQGKNVYAVTESSYPVSAPDSVLFRKSNDGGDTFSSVTNLSDNKNSHANPQVFSNENHVYVTWRNYYDNYFKDLVFVKSDDYGTTFGNQTKLNTNKPDTEMYNDPFLEISGNKTYVSWEEIHQGPVQMQYQLLRTSTDGGNTFGQEQKLTDTLSMSYNLQQGGIVLGKGQNVYYLYPGPSNQLFDIPGVFFKKSSDGAKTFGETLDLDKLNPTPYDMYNPQITVSGNNVYVTADTQDTGTGILFVSSHDNGTTFGKVININNYDSDVSKTGILSPIQQLHSGVLSQNVKCSIGLELVINSQNSPACVRHVTLPRLLSHGWIYGIDDISDAASKKMQDVVKIHDRIRDGGMLVPVTITEVVNNAESLGSVMDWNLIPLGYNGDNRGVDWDLIPNSYPMPSGVVDTQGKDVIDNSRMPENYAITDELRLYPTICGSEKVRGEGGHPFPLPIKQGNPTVFVNSAGRGILPDSSGTYTVRFLSFFETTVDFPNDAKIISNETKSCFLEHKMDNFTRAYYTKAVFKLD